MIVFVSCSKNAQKWEKIHHMCNRHRVKNYVIAFADPNIEKACLVGNYLVLRCNDDYCALPEKMMEINKVILKFFPKIKGYLKVDDDVRLKNDPKSLLLSVAKYDFTGFHFIDAATQDGKWHIKRCPGSNWNTKKINILAWSKKFLNYDKNFTICAGGSTYYLSKKSINCIKNCKINARTHVLEDVLISNILAKNDIIPYKQTIKDNYKISMKYIKLNNKTIFTINN